MFVGIYMTIIFLICFCCIKLKSDEIGLKKSPKHKNKQVQFCAIKFDQ